MGQGTVMTKGEQLSVKQQGRLWWRERELREALVNGPLSYAEYMAKTGVMLAQAGVAAKKHAVKPRVRDLAAERQQEMQEWYHGLRRYIEAPTPQVSNREFLRRQRLGQELVWRSADLSPHVVDLFFECALRYAFGEMVSRIQWDQARRGYWFWGDAAARCPRAGSPRGVAGPGKQIMGIEEYAVLWRFSKDVLGVTLDINTKTLLRTTLDRSCSIPHALHASSKSGAYVEVGYDEIVREGDPLEGIRLVERLAA